MIKITDNILSELRERFEKLGLQLIVSQDTAGWIASQIQDEKYGARPLRRSIQHNIEDTAAEMLLDGRARSGDSITAVISEGKLTLKTGA